MPELINIHAIIPSSRVNGPGKRLVAFFQGCGRFCPGCFNPETHPFEARTLMEAGEVLSRHSLDGIEGLTVSGGEPFAQAAGLLELLKAARSNGLSTVVYTGFTIEELSADPLRAGCLGLIDVLIDGPYVEGLKETTMLARGSSNQRLHFLTAAYAIADFYMPGKVELTIRADGAVVGTGFSQARLRAAN